MKRPLIITLFCVAAWLWLFIMFPSIFSPETKKISLLLPSLYGIIIALQFIGLVGIWHMKKWGLEWFIILLFIKNLIDNFVTNNSEASVNFELPLSFIVWLVSSILIAAFFYKKMSKGF